MHRGKAVDSCAVVTQRGPRWSLCCLPVFFPCCFQSPLEPVLIPVLLRYVGHLRQSRLPLSWKERLWLQPGVMIWATGTPTSGSVRDLTVDLGCFLGLCSNLLMEMAKETPFEVPEPLLPSPGTMLLPEAFSFSSLQQPGKEPGAENMLSSLLHKSEEGSLWLSSGLPGDQKLKGALAAGQRQPGVVNRRLGSMAKIWMSARRAGLGRPY